MTEPLSAYIYWKLTPVSKITKQRTTTPTMYSIYLRVTLALRSTLNI